MKDLTKEQEELLINEGTPEPNWRDQAFKFRKKTDHHPIENLEQKLSIAKEALICACETIRNHGIAKNYTLPIVEKAMEALK
jgi:hypothetical protein